MDNIFKNKGLNVLLNLDLFLTAITFCVLVTITFTGVIFRYFLNNPIVWQEEAQLMCFIWVIYFGASVAARNGSHVAIDMVVDRFSPFCKRIVEAIMYIILIIILGYACLKSIDLIQQMVSTGRTTNILKIPSGLIYSCVPIGCVLTIINFAFDYYYRITGRVREGVENIG